MSHCKEPHPTEPDPWKGQPLKSWLDAAGGDREQARLDIEAEIRKLNTPREAAT